MLKKIKIAPKKSQWVGKRTIALKGTRLNYNASLQLRYQRKLRALTRLMTTEVKNSIIKLFKTRDSDKFFEQQKKATMDESITSRAKKLMKVLTKKFDQLFNKESSDLATAMLTGTLKTSETNLRTSLKQLSGGLTLNTGVVPAGMEEIAQAIINENVSLIKSVPQKYLDEVTGAVMRSITSGNGLQDLEPRLKELSGQTDRRVKLLALDQTRKAYNAINKQRMQSVGVKKFEWVHSGGGQHPRKSHMALDGRIFSFDDLPLKGEEGFTNGQYPGQAINCACTMVPVIEFEDGTEI